MSREPFSPHLPPPSVRTWSALITLATVITRVTSALRRRP